MSVPTGLEYPGEVGTLEPGGAAGDFKALFDRHGKARGRKEGLPGTLYRTLGSTPTRSYLPTTKAFSPIDESQAH